MWQSFTTDNNTPRDNPCEQWLIEAVQLAEEIVKRLLDGRLAESGKALVLKTSETETLQGFESSTFRH